MDNHKESMRGMLKGGSIMETVMAITVITICTLIATLLYSSVVNAVPPAQKHQANFELAQWIEQTIDDSDIEEDEKTFGSIKINKRVKKTVNPDLYEVSFQVSAKNKVFSKQILIRKEQVEN